MRCLVYSSNRLFGQCLAKALKDHDRITSAVAPSSPSELPEEAERQGATLMLIDLACPVGRQILPRIARTAPELCVIGLSVDDRVADNVVYCARLGCHAIVPQDAEIEDVVEIMREAEGGRVRLKPQVAATMMRALAATAGPVPPGAQPAIAAGLTRREREICRLLCEGLTNKEIALEMGRSVATVKNHVHSILTKLDLPRRGAIPGRLMSEGMQLHGPRSLA